MIGSAEYESCLRKGKWTAEEEKYANFIIHHFNEGSLGLEAGTTLRSYLSEKLKCDPMRITKKFAGDLSIGKQVYRPCPKDSMDYYTLKNIKEELDQLEIAFTNKLRPKNVNSRSRPRTFAQVEATGQGHRTHRHRERPLEYADYYMAEKLDSLEVFDDTKNSARKAAKVASFQDGDSIFPLNDSVYGGDMNGYREVKGFPRSFSAPNLTAVSLQYPSREDAYLRSELPTIPEEEKAVATSLRKRSYSSMALMDFEKLIDDDQAADFLFVEFVASVQSLKRKRVAEPEIPIKQKNVLDNTVTLPLPVPTGVSKMSICESSRAVEIVKKEDVSSVSCSKEQEYTDPVIISAASSPNDSVLSDYYLSKSTVFRPDVQRRTADTTKSSFEGFSNNPTYYPSKVLGHTKSELSSTLKASFEDDSANFF